MSKRTRAIQGGHADKQNLLRTLKAFAMLFLAFTIAAIRPSAAVAAPAETSSPYVSMAWGGKFR